MPFELYIKQINNRNDILLSSVKNKYQYCGGLCSCYYIYLKAKKYRLKIYKEKKIIS